MSCKLLSDKNDPDYITQRRLCTTEQLYMDSVFCFLLTKSEFILYCNVKAADCCDHVWGNQQPPFDTELFRLIVK